MKTKSLSLIRQSCPVVQVINAQDAPAVEEYAAEELIKHLTQACSSFKARRSSAVLTIIYINHFEKAKNAGIAIGQKDLADEEFCIESKGNEIFILGGKGRGALYGVYELLEMIGFRWFAPDVTKIPSYQELDIAPIKVRKKPAFEFRDIFTGDCNDPVWWVRNRLNGWYVKVPEFMGGHIDYGLWVHTFYGLVPPAEFFDEHPEYFSLLDGKRTTNGAQLCLSNPDLVGIVSERVLQKMRSSKSRIFSVSQNDWHGACECPECQKIVDEEGSQAGPVVRFVNKIAEITSKEFPDNYISTLAYTYTLDAPAKVVPHPNVRIRLCSIRCCQAHGIGECDHEETERFNVAISKWAKITSQMYVWHYCTNFSNYPLPMPNFNEIRANINFYHNYGVYGIFMQGAGDFGAESMDLRSYLISRLLWDPKQDIWPLVDEWLDGVYGEKAAPLVRKYYDLFHQKVINDNIHPSCYDMPDHELFQDKKLLKNADETLAKAEKLVRGNARKRIKLLRGGLALATVYNEFKPLEVKGNTYSGNVSKVTLKAFDNMIRDYKAIGVRQIRESNSINQTAHLLRARFASHKVIWLKNKYHKIAVVPELGGRLVEWHALGRQWLCPPDMENKFLLYPYSEGYAEYTIHGVHHFDAWNNAYEVNQTGNTVKLSTTILKNGLSVSRTYSLQDEILHIDSIVKNPTQKSVKTAWGGGMHFKLEELPTCHVKHANHSTDIDLKAIDDGLEQSSVIEDNLGNEVIIRMTLPEYSIENCIQSNHLGKIIIGKKNAMSLVAMDTQTAFLMLKENDNVQVRQRFRLAKKR